MIDFIIRLPVGADIATNLASACFAKKFNAAFSAASLPAPLAAKILARIAETAKAYADRAFPAETFRRRSDPKTLNTLEIRAEFNEHVDAGYAPEITRVVSEEIRGAIDAEGERDGGFLETCIRKLADEYVHKTSSWVVDCLLCIGAVI